MLFEKYHNGLNLGGWLSQYEIVVQRPEDGDCLEEHFGSFITRADLERIAGWGYDHVRLPLSGYLIYDRELGKIKPGPLGHIDSCVAWCRELGLSIVLDLHDVWGNVFGAMDTPMPLLTQPELREVFYRVWEQLAEHFAGAEAPAIMFELLNEVSDASGHLWNELWREALGRIRRIDPLRPVLIGSNGQNSVACLDQLELADDPNVYYNFHYYEPLVFTHQRAHFNEELRGYGQTVTYPGDISGFIAYLEAHPEFASKYELCGWETRNDRALMEKLTGMAVSFQERTGRELYCGEFGVIDTAPPEERVKWIADLTAMLDAHHIGHAMWNYKELDFELVDINGKVVSDVMLAGVVPGEAAQAKQAD